MGYTIFFVVVVLFLFFCLILIHRGGSALQLVISGRKGFRVAVFRFIFFTSWHGPTYISSCVHVKPVHIEWGAFSFLPWFFRLTRCCFGCWFGSEWPSQHREAFSCFFSGIIIIDFLFLLFPFSFHVISFLLSPAIPPDLSIFFSSGLPLSPVMDTHILFPFCMVSLRHRSISPELRHGAQSLASMMKERDGSLG